MLWSYLFGCMHDNHTFPQTPRRGQKRPAAALVTGVYVACLDCGRDLPYDWTAMRIVSPREQRARLRLESKVSV